MPAKRTALVAKQRVRTGCLTCRKRRRKCDEGKPSCDNCKAKGFTCQYGASHPLTFVIARKHGAPQPQGEVDTTVEAYSTITFVNAPSASTPIQSRAVSLDQYTPIPNDEGDNGSVPPARTSREFVGEIVTHPEDISRTRDAHVQFDSFRNPYSSTVSERALQQDSAGSLITSGIWLPAVDSIHTPYSNTSTHSTHGYQQVNVSSRASSSLETDLLSHFRYNVAPWIDVGDSKSFFGINALLLVKADRPILAAILSLSARQRSLLKPQRDGNDLESSIRFRAEAERGASENGASSGIISGLLTLQDLLSSSPLQWRNILLQGVHDIAGFPSRARSESHDDASFWLQYKFDLASSIINGQVPLMALPSHLIPAEQSRRFSRELQLPHSPETVYRHSLSLLGSCLSLIHNDYQRPSQFPLASVHTTDEIPQNSRLAQWTWLWSESQKWYVDRPVEMQQILEIRGIEADYVDTQAPSSFPILIYTTPVALVANATYHLTSLLLLTHKPRLLRALAGPRCFTSHIWHAQSIAGITTSNESLEQWGPILIAGLLLIARDMTHESQHSILLERLARIKAVTGIKLDREIEILKSTWNMSRYDEEMDD